MGEIAKPLMCVFIQCVNMTAVNTVSSLPLTISLQNDTMEAEQIQEIIEICAKTTAEKPYETTIVRDKNKNYTSAYGEEYPRTVFVKSASKVRKSNSFLKRLKKSLSKFSKISDLSSSKNNNNEINGDAEISVSINTLESALFNSTVKRTSEKLSSFHIDPLTSAAGKIFLVM